jgi:hypothetical protein
LRQHYFSSPIVGIFTGHFRPIPSDQICAVSQNGNDTHVDC